MTNSMIEPECTCGYKEKYPVFIDHHWDQKNSGQNRNILTTIIVDNASALIDTCGIFRKVSSDLLLENTVIPIIAISDVVSSTWPTSLSMIFINGGHEITST
jgi:hypothetical protein